MLLLGVCSLTYSQKLSLGIFPEPQEVTISSQTYAPPHGYTLRGINNPDADAVKLLKEALPFAKSGKSLPLEIKKLKDKTPEMQRSGAYTLTIILQTALEPRRPYRANPLLRKDQAEHLYLWSER